MPLTWPPRTPRLPEACCVWPALTSRTPCWHLAGYPPVSLVCPSVQLCCVSSLCLSTLRWAVCWRGPSRGLGFGPTLERGPGDRRLLAPPLPLERAFCPPFPRESFQGRGLGRVRGCRVRCTDYPVKASTLFRVWRRAETDWACGRPDKPLGRAHENHHLPVWSGLPLSSPNAPCPP